VDKYLEALHWRFATKEFSDKPVPEEEIKFLLEAARLAPGSLNIQPWKIIVIQDKELLKKMLPVSYNQPQVATTSCLFVFCANKDLKEAFSHVIATMRKAGATPEQTKGYEEMVHGAIANLTPVQQHEFADRQMYIALGSVLSAAALHRIDAGPMEGLDPAGVAKVLELPKNLVPRANVAIGYRKAEPTRAKVRNPSDIMIERR
jgi:nitroreductase / dihydropteridine reductase